MDGHQRERALSRLYRIRERFRPLADEGDANAEVIVAAAESVLARRSHGVTGRPVLRDDQTDRGRA